MSPMRPHTPLALVLRAASACPPPAEHPEPPPVAAILMSLDGPEAARKRSMGRDMLTADNYGVWTQSFRRGVSP